MLAPTHAKVGTVVRVLNAALSSLRLEKHPDKTFIGKIERGFDFLGYRFGAPVLTLAAVTIEKFVEHATLLYEQERRQRVRAPLLGDYVRRWTRWAKGGLGGLDVLWPAQFALAGPFHPMGIAVLSGQPAPYACLSGRGCP